MLMVLMQVITTTKRRTKRMDVTELDKLRLLIKQELGSIDEHIKELEQNSQPVSPDNAIGRLSRMEAIGERGVYQTALAAARQRQHELREALVRIDGDPEYGRCESCGEPIPLPRLMLVPESRFCVKCIEDGLE
jgi:DnaK suppressor protein